MLTLIPRTINRWLRNDGLGLAAAISFYSIFAMAPLFLIVVLLSSYLLGSDTILNSLDTGLVKYFPETDFKPIIKALQTNSQTSLATGGLSLTSLLILLWAASGIFNRMQFSVRKIFEHSSDTFLGILGITVKGRLQALIVCLGAGIILALGSAGSSVILSLHKEISISSTLLIEMIFNFLLGLIAIFTIAASIRNPKPNRVALFFAGALFFSTMFFGRVLVSQFLQKSDVSTAYGIASSIVVALIWIYFAALCFGLSASFCAEITNMRRRKAPPRESEDPGETSS